MAALLVQIMLSKQNVGVIIANDPSCIQTVAVRQFAFLMTCIGNKQTVLTMVSLAFVGPSDPFILTSHSLPQCHGAML